MQSLWMLVAAFVFSIMGVCVKLASEHASTSEIVIARGVVGVSMLLLLTRVRGLPLATHFPWQHAWRGFVGVSALWLWFFAIARLPLATAMTLNYMSGIWVAAFIVGGALLMGKSERQGPLLLTVLTGFAGVVLTLRPTLDQNQLFAGLVGLLSGMCASLAYLQVTALGRAGEPVGRTVFYFAIGTAVVGGAGSLVVGFTPWAAVSWQALAWLVPIGVFASLGQWCMTRAYSRGHTLVVASLQYSGIVFAALYSLVLFGDDMPWSAWSGIGLIVASGVAATFLRERALPDTPAEDH